MKNKLSLAAVLILLVLTLPFCQDLPMGRPYLENVGVNLPGKTLELITPESEEFGRSSGSNTIIVTSDREAFSEPFTTKLAVWLRAVFSARVDVVPQDQLTGYKLPYHLRDKKVIVYYGTDYDRGPGARFIDYSFDRVNSGGTKLVWIGYHGDKIKKYLTNYGIGYGGGQYEFNFWNGRILR